MKICVEVKKRKHFKKLDKVYNTEKIESEWFYDKNTVIDITDGCYYNLEYAKEENFKILTYKQWKAVMEGGFEEVAIRTNHVDRFLELSGIYWNNNFRKPRDKKAWNTPFNEKLCVDVSGEFGNKKWYKEKGYFILSYKEWKAIRGKKQWN